MRPSLERLSQLTEHNTDVAVIGAGPAGSATAIFLARRGFRVTLLDRTCFPRSKPCGEYLTPGAVRLLRDELDVLPSLLAQGAMWVAQERVIAHTGRGFFGPTAALACPRVVTDQTLRDEAERCGVQVLEGFAARRVLWEGSSVIGVGGDDAYGEPTRILSRVTVGADGTHSLLARALGVVRPLRRLQRLALVGHFAGMRGEDDTAAVTMHLPRDGSDACCGVGPACGPTQTRNVNIVVPTSEASAMSGRHEAFFRERLRRSFPQVWERLGDASPAGPFRSVGCFGHHTTRATGDGAVLVGDAATFIHPFTGEGVFFALRGAQLAAEAIGAALQADDGSRALRGYDDARRRELMPRYRLCDAVQRVVHSPPLLAWAAERLRRSARLTDTVLQTVGDVARPADLFSLPTLRLALGSL